MEGILDVTWGHESTVKVYGAVSRILEKLDLLDAGWRYLVKSVQEWSRIRNGYGNTWPLSLRTTRDVKQDKGNEAEVGVGEVLRNFQERMQDGRSLVV